MKNTTQINHKAVISLQEKEADLMRLRRAASGVLESMRSFYALLFELYKKYPRDEFLELLQHLGALNLVTEGGQPTARLRTIMAYFDAQIVLDGYDVIGALADVTQRPGSVPYNVQNASPVIRKAVELAKNGEIDQAKNKISVILNELSANQNRHTMAAAIDIASETVLPIVAIEVQTISNFWLCSDGRTRSGVGVRIVAEFPLEMSDDHACYRVPSVFTEIYERTIKALEYSRKAGITYENKNTNTEEDV